MSDGGLRGQEDQHPFGCRAVQIRPGHLDLVQLPQAIRAEVVNGAIIARLSRSPPELTVEARPREPERTFQREGPVGKPQVQIQAQRRALKSLQDVQIQRDRVADDLVEELLAQFNLAIPKPQLTGCALAPPESGPAGNR